jgi:CRP-like cAMP-binding protein
MSTHSDYSEQELLKCIQASDVYMDQLLCFDFASVDGYNQQQFDSYHKISSILIGFKDKTPFRSNIQLCDFDIHHVIPLYTHRIIIHLSYVLMELPLFADNSNPNELSAISNFVNWKERIGRERALGVVGIALDEFNSEEFDRDYSILLGEQKLNQHTFQLLASSEQKQLYDNYDIKNESIDLFHEQLENKQKPNITAEMWFQLASDRMEIMHQLELSLFKHQLKAEIVVTTSHSSHLNINEKNLIVNFPFFRNLSDKTLDELLRLSNVKTYPKGRLLFLEGEQASRIYVLLSGWVKIYKGNTDGNEVVENMLTTGDLVIESTIFASDKYYSSAQVSNQAKLLSFPSSIYRKLLKNDLKLALNSLKYLSQSSRNYLNQIDNNRIKSSRERVGQFLLKQFIKQKNPNTILLPYEKTIIASLLDMKPETFSRSLKSFKNQGLKSEKHQIQIENINMLCNYCDAEIAQKCKFKEKNDCKFK